MRWPILGILSLALFGCVAEKSTATPSPTSVLTTTASATPPPTATIPPDIEVATALVDLYCPTDNEEAKQAYNAGRRLDPNEGKVDEARQMYLKAIELDPDYCDAMDNLGLLYRREGNLEEAIKWYKRSIEVLYENPVPHQNLGHAYLLQGKTDEAMAEYQVLLELDPNNPEGYYGLGNVYLIREDYQEAVEQFKKAEELYLKASSPYVSDARYKLGLVYYALRDCATASDYFELVYSDYADDPALNFYLGLCYLTPELNNLELARKYLLKAQDLGVEIPSDVLNIIKP